MRFMLVALLCTSCCLPLPWNEDRIDPAVASDPVSPAPVAPVAPGRIARASFDSLALGAVPQVPGIVALYETAGAHPSGPLVRGLMLCRVELVSGHYDDSLFAGGADIALMLRARSGEVRSTRQSSDRVYSFPIARLDPGDAIWMRVIDQDVLFHDTVAEGATTFRQAPLSISMGAANVWCRTIEGDAVARPASEAIARMTSAIEEMERASPDLAAHELGYPHDRSQRVIEAARRALAWIDPSDAAYIAQTQRAIAFDAEWSRRAAAAVHAAGNELPRRGTSVAFGTGRRIRVADVACGDRATALAAQIGTAMEGGTPACLVTLEIHSEHRTSFPALDGSGGQLDVTTVSADARLDRGFVVARRRGDAWIPPAEIVPIEPGEHVDVVISLSTDAPILRVADSGTPIVLRLR